MTPLTYDQLLVTGLVFLLGLLVGMFVMAGGKWKRMYREEHARARELEAENARLRRDEREMDSLRGAAARSGHAPPVEDRPVHRGPVDGRP